MYLKCNRTNNNFMVFIFFLTRFYIFKNDNYICASHLQQQQQNSLWSLSQAFTFTSLSVSPKHDTAFQILPNISSKNITYLSNTLPHNRAEFIECLICRLSSNLIKVTSTMMFSLLVSFCIISCSNMRLNDNVMTEKSCCKTHIWRKKSDSTILI